MKWNKLPQYKATANPIILPMLLTPVDNCFTMVDFFNYYFTNEIIDLIVDCTNQDPDEYTTRKEIRAFIGLLLIFGVTKKHDIEINMIWKEDSLHYCKWAAITMSRDRFKVLTSHITFDDVFSRKTREKTIGKFYLMNNIFEKIRIRVVEAFNPGQNLCVDETLYPFRGRCRFRQYMKSKPARYGIKYWAIGCVESGYLCDLKVYLGKSDEKDKRAVKLGESVLALI